MSPSSRRRIALVAAAALAAPSCTVADNLTAAEILDELDNIVRIEGSGDERRVEYNERAAVSSWYMRWFLFVPIRGLLAAVFGRTSERTLENPAAHVRELLAELPDETGGDLLTCLLAATRCGWLAELDRNPATRILAIDCLAAISQQLGLKPFAGPFDQLRVTLADELIAAARAAIQSAAPENRTGPRLTDAQLASYEQALAALTSLPVGSWQDRLLLVEDLTALLIAERDRRARPAIHAATRAALVYVVEGTLLRSIQGRAPQLAEVRLCAMEQMRRLGGPRTVPLMLAVMTASPAELARGESRFDPDALVQLRLIHYCGQLDGERARTALVLPGRAAWEALSPADYLASTVLNEQDYYSRLRLPALAALTWCLGRPRLDPDPEWVRAWREGEQP